MTRVTGTLHHVLGNAEAITEVWVRSARARGHGGGWLMETSARTPITDAHLSLDITPGPAVLVAVAEGQPLEHIEIIVPDADSETLEHCITAAQGTSGRSAEVLDLLRQQIASDLSESAKAVTNSRAAASEAESSAHAAASSASEASRSADAAASADSSASEHEKHAASHATAAARSEKDAQSSASAAAGDADRAKQEADRSTSQAGNAAASAGEAKTHADRAENVIDHVDWYDDRLMVMGTISPPLTGPKGDKGEPGLSGASTWDAITEKPDTFPPTAHKHKVADISDLPSISYEATGMTIPLRTGDGHIRVNTPTFSNDAAPKSYVDRAVAETRAFAETRAIVRQVTSPPSTHELGVLYVIPE
ncbi:hypothetical protein HMPREF3088_05400 [Corynebacterium sp. HMSC22B11]|uniref:hypothetical protein n=1 Tax=Corynebacterium sp. HMSC22B11 TaxID=1581056 RepID=UPI0008A55C66|nr:hypothetical protein [Corynebacterium sp. HMSC22B11]OFO13761.1 hypothetical protein HMPREF3088_05400 [Corynebacterium sp. HMSC22B11]